MLLDFLFVLIGFVALMLGAELLVRGGASLALRFGISPLLVGLTIVSLGTSAPELVTCVTASLRGSSDIALGNVIGSNICNIGLILGLTVLVTPLTVQSRVVKLDVPLMLGFSLLLLAFLINGRIEQWEALIFLAFTIGFTWWLAQMARSGAEIDVDAPEKTSKSVWLDIGFLVAGTAALALGGDILIRGAVGLAGGFGVSEALISLSLIAFGTSVPELATCLVAARKGEGDIAVGNVIGSNIYNIIFILGASGIIKPLIGTDIRWMDLGVMFGLSLLTLPLMITGGKLVRWEGGLLLAVYLSYMTWRFVGG
jgi:cation:H+ antiporter